MNDKKFLGLRTAIYQVDDIARAKKWYAKAFATEPYFDEPFYVGFSIAGYELGLQPATGKAGTKPESVAAYWGVNDVQEAYNHMIASGATAHSKPQNVGGEIVVATVKDPWDNVIGLIYNPEFRPASE
jgi:predicted enzyme related to lactoylglutathione lyase